MSLSIRPAGESGYLIDVTEGDPARLAEGLRTGMAEAVDVVPGFSTVLVTLAAPMPLPAFRARVERAAAEPVAGPAGGGPVIVDVHYDGPDLETVAALAGMSPREVVELHTTTEFHVAFSGFAPGFGYLTGLPERLRVPRRAEPRAVVPGGSVALADRFTAVYPRASPGGWQLIGRTDLALWDSRADPPAVIRPGRTVRFRAVA